MAPSRASPGMRVLVTASNSAGPSTVSSPPTNVVAGFAPANDSAPTIAGLTKVGETLAANAGAWRGSQPLTYAYQWQRCDPVGAACVNLDGETSPALTLDASVVGATIRVVVTATNVLGSVSAVSSPAGPVRALPQCVVPRVTGKALANAGRAIVRAHCTLGAVTRVRSAKVKKGQVISQRPRPGKHLANGARVRLVVSRRTPHT